LPADIVQAQFAIAAPPDDGMWFSRLTHGYPDVQVKIVFMLPIGASGGNILLIFKGHDRSRCVSELRTGTGIVSSFILHEEKNKIFVNIKSDRTPILHALIDLEIPLKYPITVEAGNLIINQVTERKNLDDFLTRMTSQGYVITLLRIGRVNTRSLLTETQEKILQAAIRVKYFEIPRGTKLQDLASEIGIGTSSLSEDMRRIFKKLALNYNFENQN
jgi:predicted DNA binding protein